MQPPESIETMLERLMPVAISEGGQRSLDTMLDELCGSEAEDDAAEQAATAAPAVRKRFWKYAVPPFGIAAATALMFFHPTRDRSIQRPVVTNSPSSPDMVLMGESDRIETLSDEGLVADPQGMVMQAVRVKVIEENTLRDEQTGIVVSVSEPREELLLFDVNAF